MDENSTSLLIAPLWRARRRSWFPVALLLVIFFLVTPGTPAKTFEHAKPHINILTLGQIGHGKTALTSAITKVLAAADKAKFVPARRLRNTPKEKEHGLAIAIARVEYETEKRRYTHADMPSHADYVKGMIAGAVHMDGAILVVSANHGPTSETRKHVFLAGQVGIPEIVVFLNEVTRVDDAELWERVETNVRALLSSHGFSGDHVPVIRGSARTALAATEEATGKPAVLDLIAAMDEHIPQPERAKDLPFLMPIEDVFSIAGRGTIVTGRVECGVIEVGDEVEIVGLNDTTRTVFVTGVEMFRKRLDQAQAGDNVGLLLRGINRAEVRRGQVLAKPGSMTAHRRFKAEAYFLTKEEGGRSAPVFSRYRPQFYFRTTDVTGLVKLSDKIEMAMPGDNVTIEVDLERPIAMQKGLRFAIRDGGRTNGIGIVTEILD